MHVICHHAQVLQVGAYVSVIFTFIGESMNSRVSPKNGKCHKGPGIGLNDRPPRSKEAKINANSNSAMACRSMSFFRFDSQCVKRFERGIGELGRTIEKLNITGREKFSGRY